MPFEGERAQYRAIQRISQSSAVQAMLGNSRVNETLRAQTQRPIAAEVSPSNFLPKFVLAIDGSKQELPARNGFPGAEFAYITVANVVIDVEMLGALDTNRPIDPAQFRKIENAECADAALPGCNVIYKDEVSAKASFRRSLFEWLEGEKGWDGCESLLDTYEALFSYRRLPSPGCPWDECEQGEDCNYRGERRYQCPCGKRSLYSTDSLRIHEGFNSQGSNGEAFGEVMQVAERLKLVHLLRMLEQRNMLSILSRVAFVMDGPLAVYGRPAWLSQPFIQELSRINRVVRGMGLPDLLILGIEKTGIFAEHLRILDLEENGSPGRLPKQSAYLLNDEYIKKNIVFRESPKIYGSQTYFGRKFFYKTKSGSLIVGSVPFLAEEHRFLETANIDQFPRLADALALLDRMETSRYPNSLIPLTAAHAEASLPMSIGRKVLERMARDLMSPPS